MSAEAPPSLQAVIERLATSPADEDAWAHLYRLMRPYVFAVVYRRVRGVAGLAEDITQEVFIRLARSRPFVRVRDADAFRRYVWRVADNVARTHVRGLMRRAAVEAQSGGAMHEEGLSDAAVDSGSLLLEGIQELEVRDRELLGLVLEGHSLADIARLTGLTYTNVGVRLHRLRQRLRKWLTAKTSSAR